MSETRFERDTREFQETNYGKRFVGASLGKLEIPDWAGEKLIKFMAKPKNILLFCGCPGIGKTYFCSSITEWMLKTFNTFRYHREEDLLRRLRSVIHDSEGDYSKEIELLCDDEFIILDDVGSGIDYNKKEHKNLEWRAEVFFTFLDYRYRTEKPTVITSNFTRKIFTDIYSPRIESRLFAFENTIIEIEDGVDKRKIDMSPKRTQKDIEEHERLRKLYEKEKELMRSQL